MLPDNFLGAWVLDTHRVLGRRLQPYSLWHRFALEAIGSPFTVPDGRPLLGDLDVAVKVCRSRYPATDAASFFRVIKIHRPGKPLPILAKLRFAYLLRRFDGPTEGTRFVAYVRDHLSPPKFWEQTGEGTQESSGAPPEVLSTAARLVAGGFTEERAWNMPIGKAYWYAATIARMNGVKVDFVSESNDLFAFLQRLKDMHKAGKLKFTSKGYHCQE